MKGSIISSLVVAGMLAACTGQTGQSSGDQPDKRAHSRDDASSKAEVHRTVRKPMFDGYEPGFEYELRADKVTTNKDGKQVRRVVVEYIESDQTKLIAAIDHGLALHGYAGKPWRQDAGSTSTQYIKKGAPRVGITITPANDASPTRSPEADGSVKFVWVEGNP